MYRRAGAGAEHGATASDRCRCWWTPYRRWWH